MAKLLKVIKVYNNKECIALQNKLFTIGYMWEGYKRCIITLDVYPKSTFCYDDFKFIHSDFTTIYLGDDYTDDFDVYNIEKRVTLPNSCLEIIL